MSKDKVKSKTKGRRLSHNTTSPYLNHQPAKRCNIIKQINGDDGIAKSKQLVQKMEFNRSFGRPKTRINNNNEPRVCGNGKPMPSLADLEKMFEDSDDDPDEPKINKTSVTLPNIKAENSTPRKTNILSEDKLKSPTTIKKIADKMLDFISNLPDATVLLDEDTPTSVIPIKKRKKTDIPYIVGCKDRPQVVSKSTTNFCKGDEDYGVDKNNTNSDEDDYPKQRAKRSKVANISKSIFNEHSDEIAARLKECDTPLSDCSSDSNKTVAYEYSTPNTSVKLRSFSPLPSTSRDSETIHKNDIRFNESLIAEKSEDMENDLEVIKQPLDTIVIEDEISFKKGCTTPDTSLIVLDDNSTPHSLNDDGILINKALNVDDDTCIEIIENRTLKIDDSPIVVEDYYSSLDLSQPCNNDFNDVIDVDDVIAESNAIIKKYRKLKDRSTVTLVDPQPNKTESNNIEDKTSNIDDSVVSVEKSPSNLHQRQSSPVAMINSPSQNISTAKQVINMPLSSPVEFISTSQRQNSQDVEYVSSIPSQTSPVELVSNTSRNNTSPIILRHNTLNVPHVSSTSQSLNDNNIDNVVRDFFRQNSSDGQSDTILLQCNNQTSTCNSHDHHAKTMCILTFLQSMSDLTKNYNSGKNMKKKKNTQNTLPPKVLSPPSQISENVSPQTSKGLGDCPICMESLTINPVASTICGHIFCMRCISAAIRVSGKRCPTCRKVLKGVGFHQLFL